LVSLSWQTHVQRPPVTTPPVLRHGGPSHSCHGFCPQTHGAHTTRETRAPNTARLHNAQAVRSLNRLPSRKCCTVNWQPTPNTRDERPIPERATLARAPPIN
jgi:hypothetical protein